MEDRTKISREKKDTNVPSIIERGQDPRQMDWSLNGRFGRSGSGFMNPQVDRYIKRNVWYQSFGSISSFHSCLSNYT